jgi:hypothetical protein
MQGPMKKLIEASYLTAENAAEYRTILRYFYLQHERMRDFISPEEVTVSLKFRFFSYIYAERHRLSFLC